jgi:hypothetical protein
MAKQSDFCARKRRLRWLVSLVAALAASEACSSSDGANPGGSAGSSAGGQGAGAGTAGTGATGTAGGGGTYGVGTTQCTNGIDDDGDGLIDGFDPECTGAADNDESTFATGIPGDNRDPKWQDCFFDGNSGAGDDGCRYSTDCLTGALPLTDADCTVTQQCLDFCRPLTPNGCDCFGCCTVAQPGGSTVDIMEVATCSLSNLSDTTACPRCTKSTQCGNTCGECELCLGKTQADLPASCTPTGTGGTGAGGAPPVYTCDNGAQVCGPDSPCATSQYCSLGCCIGIVS